MRKRIIMAIADRIREQVPEIKYIDVFNEQIANATGGIPFPLPAVLIEFEEITYKQLSNHCTTADVPLRLHIVTRTVQANGSNARTFEASLAYFDTIDKVNKALSTLCGEYFSTLMHLGSATNHNHAELLESVERYVTRIIDKTPLRTASVVKPDSVIISEVFGG